jgi:sulfite exporter TauE/SafE
LPQPAQAAGLFTIGLLNGFLPCGPVYAALAAAIATGGIMSGSLFMFLFGLGTLPFLLTISLIGNLISINLRKKLSKLVPITIVIIGLLFVLRGMGLGIPYISPPDTKLKVPTKQEMHEKGESCH